MKSWYLFLKGTAFGLILSCIIHLMDDSTFASVMAFALSIGLLLIVVLLNPCDKDKDQD